MKRLLLAAIAIFAAWTAVDTVSHRALLAPLYDPSTGVWRPVSEMSPVLVTLVTFLLIAVFLALYAALVSPKSLARGVAFGGLLGLALGASAGFGTFIHSPIPPVLAWAWFGLGLFKGLVAGAILGALVRGPDRGSDTRARTGRTACAQRRRSPLVKSNS